MEKRIIAKAVDWRWTSKKDQKKFGGSLISTEFLIQYEGSPDAEAKRVLGFGVTIEAREINAIEEFKSLAN